MRDLLLPTLGRRFFDTRYRVEPHFRSLKWFTILRAPVYVTQRRACGRGLLGRGRLIQGCSSDVTAFFPFVAGHENGVIEEGEQVKRRERGGGAFGWGSRTRSCRTAFAVDFEWWYGTLILRRGHFRVKETRMAAGSNWARWTNFTTRFLRRRNLLLGVMDAEPLDGWTYRI
ncbi:hypothetical protein FA13DRAFT_886935 [Coprinellus micaceus]|uniref:Uncharacterized protein n=1 Tax=Coprinellus micaceus TaxID=71717 RepID=A0A4Y7TSE0_COPMI|nr:hypothetical protein FA13DRAFT_886935 [Coprinellus micaceus]